MSQIHKTKVLIVGSGPAGLTAAIYAARANLSPILVAGYTPGGQLTITTDVENYPGFATAIQGPWLMEQMTAQAQHVGTNIIQDEVIKADLSRRPFILSGDSGDTYEAETLIIATGASAMWLGLPSEKKFQGFGVSGCATCDGFFFKNKKVIVVGGGNSAVEEALYLTNHASKVTVVHRRDKFRAEKILQDRLFKNPKIDVLWNHQLLEIIGTENPKSVTHALLKDASGNETKVEVDGIFIAIGHKPNSQIFALSGTATDAEGYITVTPGSTKTNLEGVFAAGDIADKIFRQAVTAAGTGCMAALEAQKFLEACRKI